MRSHTTAVVLGFLSSVAVAAPLADVSLSAADWTKQEWDAIVVGAGPAGIIVADRLSEAGKKTLLLEDGGKSYGIVGGTDRPEWLSGTNLSRVDVPGLYKSVFADQGNLTCGSRVNAFGGCTIGGSSAINAGLYFQPPASDWDNFHPDGWKNADVAAATQRLYERQPSVENYSMDGKYYLQSGYEAAKQWLVEGAGYSDVVINDKADQKYQVFGRPSYDYANGQRGGPVTTYLQTALGRSNFQLQSGVRVQRIARTGGKATGVVATVDGAEATIKLSSSGRVVLSAGAVQSPQILMYSAIGEPATLSRLSTGGKLGDNAAPSAWINNTAVGAGLFDNPNTFIELESTAVSSYTYSYASPPESDKQMFLNHRSGPYSFASQTSVFWTYINHTDGSLPTGVQGTIDSAGYSDFTDANTITLNIYGTSGLLSAGRVVLDDKLVAGPSDDVYYSDAAGRDADDIARFIRDIFDRLPAAGLEPLNIARNATKDEIKTYITTASAYARGMVNHWSSSCRIGACVDANAQVVGTENVHVVDGSIVAPLTVNPQFGIMVAAERASELIKAL
ncbi:putative cellobiose dehydrogenase protein [Neofusicoccum parvum]|uniref:Putative cellobiose dehydrogenase protein n=1 Tax=Botryosphaeria parva (strain UCR-NP2) TaxID=1287680 RepID=R1GWA7_BOTPV|nr:putative cellobiose dehydrogenase protein [Neofusicoccum parvum UCRNP2]GME64136.1 putative cellobiose dehydrogenase protein [Neofusicoccum parvum]